MIIKASEKSKAFSSILLTFINNNAMIYIEELSYNINGDFFE